MPHIGAYMSTTIDVGVSPVFGTTAVNTGEEGVDASVAKPTWLFATVTL